MDSHEKLWAGDFGDEYIERNRGGGEMIACRTGNLARCLARTHGIKSSLEIGSNIGYNEIALKRLFPNIKMEVIEINKRAAEECGKIDGVKAHNIAVKDYVSKDLFDLTLVNGVLVYIQDDELRNVYECLYCHSAKYILIIEYYNPTPVPVIYRGHEDQMKKRDFCGEMMDIYTDLRLLDYGFIYHRDQVFPMDDFNWFLLEK